MKCQRYVGCSRWLAVRHGCAVASASHLSSTLPSPGTEFVFPKSQDCQDCNRSRLRNGLLRTSYCFFLLSNLWLAYFIKFMYFFLNLCNCLAADGKHMWVTSPVLCGSRGEWSTKKWFQVFFLVSFEATNHNLVTLLARESALAMFAEDVLHDKKIILRCNMSPMFSNLSTLKRLLATVNFSEDEA